MRFLSSSPFLRDLLIPNPRQLAPSTSPLFLLFLLRSDASPPKRGLQRLSSSSSSGGGEGGSVANRLWIKSREESLPPIYSPFMVCLISGGLKMDTFRYEMAKDYAVDDDVKSAISELRKSVVRMHNSVLEVEGDKDYSEIATPSEMTKITAHTVVVMTPYMRLNAFLWKKTLQVLGHDINHHPYQKWINVYASLDFEVCVIKSSMLQIEELLDKISISFTEEELEVVENLYRQAVTLKFFYAQVVEQQTIFDLACTTVDFSTILTEIVISSALSNQPPAQMTPTEIRKFWDVFSSEYSKEYEKCVESIMFGEKAKTFDYEGLGKAMRQLSEFEKWANSRMVESRMLKGLNIHDVIRAGERLVLQDGCKQIFRTITSFREVRTIKILSCRWWVVLIHSAFLAGTRDGLTAYKVHHWRR
ncbi:hypothetical protein Taro_029337 [Colocasia esculenta]|uniref:Uncharacterized protein n=1 Tax=Colocasia esculenta TaxID=4460 RepID=A0A843VNS0_COLES|nr:hypothetical protein [Colocasia esculenta]